MTMPIEPGVVDANVLVYAMDASAVQYTASRALVEAGRTRSANLFVTLQILCEFYSIVTNARRVANPRASADALSATVGLLGSVQVLPAPANVVDIWIDLVRRRPVVGGDIFDLQLVAAMLANGVRRIYTFNTDDFRMFNELIVVTP